jgi:hypothetical protein
VFDAGGSPNPYTVIEDIITIDLFFGSIVIYQMNYLCDGQAVEFIDNSTIHSTLFREGYNYIDNECENHLEEDCCEAAEYANNSCEGVGCYIPQCTANCEWELIQCWGSTGYCWCVDENGIEIEGTSMPSWEGYPDCEDFNTFLAGDVNFDGVINVLDIVLMISFIVGDPPDENQYISGDINDDGELNVLDIVEIISLIINSEELPEECYLEPNPGPCFGYMPMYYFNQGSQSCEMFIWGGCAGAVPNQTYGDCISACE